jgi:hypothetical protein
VVEHPHIKRRLVDGPPRHDKAAGTGLSARLALFITRRVGSMGCAALFAALAVCGFPGLLGPSALQYVLWTSTIFLQLVLLSIISVGQNIAAAASDQRALATYNDAEAVLHTSLQVEAHLIEQDRAITLILEHLRLSGSATAATSRARKAAVVKAKP